MTKKMTYAMALEIAIAEVRENEVAEKLTALKESLARKSKSGERKPTATQLANENFKTAILEGMESGVKYTITELTKAIPEIAELSNQRVSAIVRQLKENGLVERVEEKRKAYFVKVEG